MKNSNNQPKHLIKGIFLLMFIFNCSLTKAQDILTMKNGEEMHVKVYEVTEYLVKFRPWDNLEGPMRNFLKTELFSVKYQNGTKEVFNINVSAQQYAQAETWHKKSSPRNDFDPDTSDFAKRKRKNFSGPRVGVTYIGPGTNSLYLEDMGKRPFTTQFGWQFEKRLFTIEDGTSGLLELIPLVGGVDQALFIPSITALIGLRSGSNRSWEFAMGPNFGLKADNEKMVKGSVGLVVALGTSFKKGNVWFPVNLAIVPTVGSKEMVKDPDTGITTEQKFETGWRVSLIIGFNYRRK